MSEVEQKKKFVYHGSMSRVNRNSVCVGVCVCVCVSVCVFDAASRGMDEQTA